jgi:hypothetical protein
MTTPPHVMPLLKSGAMRMSITVEPSGVVGEVAVNVTPEAVPGGWAQVMKLCCLGIEVATAQLQQKQGPQAPLVILPGNGEQH